MPGLQALEVGVQVRASALSVSSLPALLSGELRTSGVQEADSWGVTLCPLPLPPHCQQSLAPRGHAFSPPVPNLGVGVSGVVVRAARDKGRLSDARSDRSRCFPDAGLC